jgi:hypothetical protein
MTFKVINTTTWSYEQIAPYGKAITAAMKKLADKFPDDMTVESLAQECMTGSQQLWLILDENDAFVSFCLTQIRTVDSTGKKVVTLTNMAGDEGLKVAGAMCDAIHAWSDEIGADLTAAVGSRAWGRVLKERGYREYAVIFRRDAKAGTTREEML